MPLLCHQKLGTLSTINTGVRSVDYLPIQWYECNKRILHRKAISGQEVVLKFFNENPLLTDGDIIYQDDETLIAIDIQPCDVIRLQPATMHEMAFACYEIGNKHLPLFFEENRLLMPYDAPVFRMLESAGFNPKKDFCKLLHPIKTSVAPHAHNGESLFSKIMKLTGA